MSFSFLNNLDMDMGMDTTTAAAASQYFQPQVAPAIAPQQPLTSYNSHQAPAPSFGSSSSGGHNNNQPDPLEMFLMETRKILQSNYTQCARIEYENKKQKEINERLEKRLQTILYILIALFIICFIMAIILCWTCYQAAMTSSTAAVAARGQMNRYQLPGYSRSWTTVV